MQGGTGEESGGAPPDGDDLRRRVEDLEAEARELRRALDRAARVAHDADASGGHGAEFEACAHPTCREARAAVVRRIGPSTAQADTAAALVDEPGAPSWGPPAVDLPPDAAGAEEPPGPSP